MNIDNFIPTPPSFSEEEMRGCRENQDYAPVLFEWYKFVGQLCVLIVSIRRDSPAFRPIPSQHYHILVGLINRCARLMFSNVALSHEGKFGETTAIIDRCIYEASLKISWLCSDPSQEKFTRYLADGLKTEVEFKAIIEANITKRGRTLPIEARMLKSIDRHISEAELTEEIILTTKKLPDLGTIIDELGYKRLHYVVWQRIGSHHIHGTWPSLLFHYLEENKKDIGSKFGPRDHNCPTHINQYVSVSANVLDALIRYVNYAIEETGDANSFVSLFRSTEEEIMRIYMEAIEGEEKSKIPIA